MWNILKNPWNKQQWVECSLALCNETSAYCNLQYTVYQSEKNTHIAPILKTRLITQIRTALEIEKNMFWPLVAVETYCNDDICMSNIHLFCSPATTLGGNICSLAVKCSTMFSTMLLKSAACCIRRREQWDWTKTMKSRTVKPNKFYKPNNKIHCLSLL